MRVAHNITALTAWRNLNQISGQLGKSVERLSSGYRINKAADDPAGLVLSENLRAQIVGMDQALRNTQDGISMVQTAEGALTEIHSLLDSMRSLALHAANTATITSEAIEADQQQIDSAIESIDRIATTTAFAGKKLLDGSAGMQAQVTESSAAQSVQLGYKVPEGAEGNVTYVKVIVESPAEKAELGKGSGATFATSTATLGSATTLIINGIEVTLASSDTADDIVQKINNAMDENNVGVEAGRSSSGYIYLETTGYGSDQKIDIYDPDNVIIGATDGRAYDEGADISGKFIWSGVGWSGTGSAAATGEGLILKANDETDLAGFALTVTEDFNSTGASAANVARIYGSPLTFQIGANAGEIYKASIGNLRASNLGASVAPNGLNDLKTGGIYDLFTNPQKAVEVIDQAIKDVSAERAKLGAIQTNVLESNERSLSVTRENLQASESRIRDVDMAKEMMEFTRNSVLTQAAMAMLAQANTLPNMVLTLLT